MTDKKIIGIYGDSYAKFEIDRTDRKSWVDYLQELLGNDYEIVNHGKQTSSVFHCYRTFLNTNQGNFYNIFTVPVQGRFYSNYLENCIPKLFRHNDYWYNTYHGVLLIEQDIKRYSDKIENHEKLLEVVNSVKTYYETWSDDSHDRIVDNLLVDDLKRNFDNITFLYTEPRPDQGEGLGQISIWELDQIGVEQTWGEIVGNKIIMDKRKNHLSDENSIILAEKLKHAIENKQKHIRLSTNDFVKPARDFDFYCRWELIVKPGVNN